ncbi:MAG: hypothetical protein ABL909_04805 [Sphingopyxis sp.]
MKIIWAAFTLVITLAACDSRQPNDGGPNSDAIDANNPLDVAARDAHLIDDPGTTVPMGLYEREGAAGTDGLCLAGQDDAMRFGVVMHFGPTLICEGSGTAQHDGATIALRFDNADCQIDVAYDGRILRIPGAVPQGCDAVCGERASMAGGILNRVGWSNAEALQLNSRRDVLQNKPVRALCH